MTEEEKMVNQKIEEGKEYYTAYSNIPYYLLENEISSTRISDFKNEFGKIINLYKQYELGARFLTEGSNMDYVPSMLKYKKASMIINKEARFLFSNPPTFIINQDEVDGKNKKENAILQNYLDKVLEMNNFNSKLLKGLKDCFIGKRIAIVVNFNETSGVSITFLNSLEFIYEMDSRENGGLKKFVTFYMMNDETELTKQKWFKKVYWKENGNVYISESIYDGMGVVKEELITKQRLLFDFIPVTIVFNDGLTGDVKGRSELGLLIEYEQYYSKLANSDMDSERKSMNPIRYTIDASEGSTRNLSTSPGSFWDLQTDLEKANDGNVAAKVGTLEAQMNYSGPLKTTLDRIENEMYAEVDVPNINSEQLAGVITSGKTIQALYWGLTVRCDEKMLAWGPSLKFIVRTLITGALLYPSCVKRYTDKKIPKINYKVVVENNYPIPEDVKEEKEMDIVEIEAKTMSRKAYLKKWRKLNDEEAEKELQQIKKEYDLFENSVLVDESDVDSDIDSDKSTDVDMEEEVDDE